MADSTTSTTGPTYTQTVDQTVFIETLGGPSNPVGTNMLDRFPEEVYNKSPETHFIKFMYSLLGPAGVGWIRKQYLDAKLQLYAQGFDTFDIEAYYGDPFSFGRILTEQLGDDPSGLLTREQWDSIKARDESYRSRAITFFNAARAGGTPPGMELAAQSGLNHSVFVIENYKSLFDAHTDEPLSLGYYGRTESTEEFIVVPKQESGRTEVQVISFADATAVSGSFQLAFNGQITGSLSFSANNFTVESALQALASIGSDNVSVTGGPSPNPFLVTFTGDLAEQDVPTITVTSSLIDNLGGVVDMSVRTLVGGVQPVDEVVTVSDEFAHNMQTAIDYLRPLNSLPTTYPGTSTRTRQDFKAVHGSSSYTEAIQYVTGSDTVVWPAVDSLNWIEPGKEKEARRIQGDLQQHYVAYHTPSGVTAYTDEALSDPDYDKLVSILSNYKSEHIGLYDPRATVNFPFLGSELDTMFIYGANLSLPPCSQRMEVTTIDDETLSPLIGGTVSAAAIDSDGSGSIALQNQNWWSSLERHAPAAEILEIDLGTTRVVNWVSFDVTRKPIFISLDFDHLDIQSSDGAIIAPTFLTRDWRGVTLWPGVVGQGAWWQGQAYAGGVVYSPTLPPWQTIHIFFRDQNAHNITTRFLRLRFDRPEQSPDDPLAPFMDPVSRLPIPYSVDVRNLRVGRYTGGFTPGWGATN